MKNRTNFCKLRLVKWSTPPRNNKNRMHQYPHEADVNVLRFFTACKVHCSTECKEILEKIRGYKVEERGYIPVKVRRIYPIVCINSQA